MSDKHLRFNTKTMQYEEVHKRHSRWHNVLYIVLVGVAFGLLFIFIGTTIFKSKAVRKKEHDLAMYKEAYEKASLQYQQEVELIKKLELKDREIFKEIFETDPTDTNLLSNRIIHDEKYDLPGADISDMLSLLNSRFDKIEETSYKDFKRIKFASYLIQHNNDFIQALPIRLPLREGSYTLVSGFGKRIHPIFKTQRQHNGLDFAARAGTEVLAAGNGTVLEIPQNLAGYGTVVFISHGYGYYSLYAQLLDSKVSPGQKVKAGDIIGFVGSTGISIGPHLHYEIWKDKKPIDPIRFLFTISPKEYIEMFKVASQFNQCLS